MRFDPKMKVQKFTATKTHTYTMAAIAQSKLKNVKSSNKNVVQKYKDVLSSLLDECKEDQDLVAALEVFINAGK